MNIRKVIDISIPTKGVLSMHTTHVLSPQSIDSDQKSFDVLALQTFIGPCRVLDLTSVKKEIKYDDLKNCNIKKNERILLKTKNSSMGYNEIYTDYIYLSPSGANFLASKNIALVGIDGPKIKAKVTTDNAAHTAFSGKNIPILEGLDLSKVKEGEYFLIALPLVFTDSAVSPTRAVLVHD